MRTTVYFAAALFNSRETLFNYELARRLESRKFGGFRVFLPQRDGFEFSSLRKRLAARLSEQEVSAAAEIIIYTVDMGVFLSQSDAVVAVLDEPLDEGLLIEIAYARQLGKPVVGIRTDTRTPFGNDGDALGGIHFFPALQCSDFIAVRPASAPADLDRLALRVAKCLRSSRHRESGRGDAALILAVERLFENVDLATEGIHGRKALNRVVANYLAHKKSFDAMRPRVVPVRPGKVAK